jgi:hypothetical protein
MAATVTASNYAIRLAFQTAFGQKMSTTRHGGFAGALTALLTRLGETQAEQLLAVFERPEMGFPNDPNYLPDRKAGVTLPFYVVTPVAGEDSAFKTDKPFRTFELGKAEFVLQQCVAKGIPVTTATRFTSKKAKQDTTPDDTGENC